MVTWERKICWKGKILVVKTMYMGIGIRYKGDGYGWVVGDGGPHYYPQGIHPYRTYDPPIPLIGTHLPSPIISTLGR